MGIDLCRTWEFALSGTFHTLLLMGKTGLVELLAFRGAGHAGDWSARDRSLINQTDTPWFGIGEDAAHIQDSRSRSGF